MEKALFSHIVINNTIYEKEDFFFNDETILIIFTNSAFVCYAKALHYLSSLMLRSNIPSPELTTGCINVIAEFSSYGNVHSPAFKDLLEALNRSRI